MNTLARRLRITLFLVLAFLLFAVFIPGHLRATRFRSSPTAQEFIDIFSGRFPSHSIARHLVLLDGSSIYQETMNGWFIKYANAISGREANKQLVDDVFESLHVAEWAPFIHKYPFEVEPPNVNSIVYDSLDRGNVDAANLCSKFENARPAVGRWINDNLPELREPKNAQDLESFDEENSDDSDLGTVFRRLAEISEEDAANTMRSLYSKNRYETLNLARGTSSKRLWTEAETLVREEFSSRSDTELSRISPGGIALLLNRASRISPRLGLELIRQLVDENSEGGTEMDREAFDSAVVGLLSAHEGEDQFATILLESELLDWVELGAAPETIGALFGILFRLTPKHEILWEKINSFNLTTAEKNIAIDSLVDAVCKRSNYKGAPTAESAALAEKLLKIKESPHLVAFFWKERNTQLKLKLIDRVLEEYKSTSFAKDCVIAALGSDTVQIAPILDEIFRSGERPKLPFTDDLNWAMATSEVVKDYCRITGKEDYWEVGKSWPPMCKYSLSHIPEIEELTNFISQNPWFPGLDDAYYRLGFLKYAGGDVSGARKTLQEAFEHDFVDLDCHWEISYLYRLVLSASPDLISDSEVAKGLSQLYQNPLGLVILSDNSDVSIDKLIRNIENVMQRESDRRYFFVGDDPENRDSLLEGLVNMVSELRAVPEHGRLTFLCDRLENLSPVERARTLFFYVGTLPNNKTDSRSDCYLSSDFELPSDSYMCLERCLDILESKWVDATNEDKEDLHRFICVLKSVAVEMDINDERGATGRLETLAGDLNLRANNDLIGPSDTEVHEAEETPARESETIRGYNDLTSQMLIGALVEGDPHGEINNKSFMVLIGRDGVVNDALEIDGIVGAGVEGARVLVGCQLDPPPLPPGFAFYRLILRIQEGD